MSKKRDKSNCFVNVVCILFIVIFIVLAAVVV